MQVKTKNIHHPRLLSLNYVIFLIFIYFLLKILKIIKANLMKKKSFFLKILCLYIFNIVIIFQSK